MFVENNEVYYKEIYGIISFVSDTSISILIKRGKHRSQDVNLVVYKSDWRNIRLIKESEK